MPVFLCFAIFTRPNFPLPRSLPSSKSEILNGLEIIADEVVETVYFNKLAYFEFF